MSRTNASRAKLLTCLVSLPILFGCHAYLLGRELVPTGAMRRLNRAEYTRSLRALLGDPVDWGATLPADEVNSLGFDNDGAALNTSPFLVERWLDVAERSVNSYFARKASQTIVWPIKNRPCDSIQLGVEACGPPYGMVDSANGFYGMRAAEEAITVEGLNIVADGEYEITFKAYAAPVLVTVAGGATAVGAPYPVVLELNIDGQVTNYPITDVLSSAPAEYKAQVFLAKGKHSVSLDSISDITNPDNQDDNWYAYSAYVKDLGVTGPISAVAPPEILKCKVTEEKCVKDSLREFGRRAFRRPLRDEELRRFVNLAITTSRGPDVTGSKEEKALVGFKLALTAILSSPQFLFRPEPKLELDDYEIATRLSYFLWGMPPDESLLKAAEGGKLRNAEFRVAEARRMLASPESRAMIEDLAGQWFNLRALALSSPLPEEFPLFRPELKEAFKEETIRFVAHLFEEGVSFDDLVSATYSFQNKLLADYYGATGATDDTFVLVEQGSSGRPGLLGQGSFLLTTSHPNRTSPVLRGKFVLERLLCDAPPPPPPNVKPFNENVADGSVRKRLEQHRADPACSGCHESMDAVGFSLESFDGIGLSRSVDETGAAIDTTGLELYGEGISSAAELAQVIRGSDRFVSCSVEHFYGYALGTDPAKSDATVRRLAEKFDEKGRSLFELVLAIVADETFVTRPGERL